MSAKSALGLYYGLTPAFWLTDVVFGANVRAAALEGDPLWTTAYYLFCMACGIGMWLRPNRTSLIGLAESSVNLLLLVLSVSLPYLRVVDALAARAAVVDVQPFDAGHLASFLLSGVVWALSFYIHERRALSGASR